MAGGSLRNVGWEGRLALPRPAGNPSLRNLPYLWSLLQVEVVVPIRYFAGSRAGGARQLASPVVLWPSRLRGHRLTVNAELYQDRAPGYRPRVAWADVRVEKRLDGSMAVSIVRRIDAQGVVVPHLPRFPHGSMTPPDCGSCPVRPTLFPSTPSEQDPAPMELHHHTQSVSCFCVPKLLSQIPSISHRRPPSTLQPV